MNALEEAKKHMSARRTNKAQACALIAIAEQLRVMNLRAALDMETDQEERDMIFNDIMHTLYPVEPAEPQHEPNIDMQFPDTQETA